MLAREAEKITFWDIAVAVEGRVSLFECHDVTSGCILNSGGGKNSNQVCTVHAVFIEASQKLETFLKSRNLRWLHTTRLDVYPTNFIKRLITGSTCRN